MANEIHYIHENDVDVLYAVLRNAAKQVRNVVTGEWETHPSSGSLDDYDISAGTALGGLWSGDFPSGIDNGFYIVQMRKRAGTIPDFDDEIIGAVKGFWDGSVFWLLDEKLNKATKMLINKAVQTKSTGVIQYYGESTIERAPS